MRISSSGRVEAVQLARWSLDWHIKGVHTPQPILSDPLFLERQPAFVTLHEGKVLRGCVGRIEPMSVLGEEIPELSLAAATRDPRFHPISSLEVDRVRIEISLISPPEQVEDVAEIHVGEHGVIIERGDGKGLILPQVAREEQWDREAFLSQACIKAGQVPHAWKEPGTRIFFFTAVVISE